MIPIRAGRSGQISRVKRFPGWSAFLGIALAVWSAPAFAEAVDLELVLATDNSQSIDSAEAALQRQGVAAAFRSPEVVRAIQSGSLGRIGVAYLDWSSAPYTRIAVNWRVIKDKASADAFAGCARLGAGCALLDSAVGDYTVSSLVSLARRLRNVTRGR